MLLPLRARLRRSRLPVAAVLAFVFAIGLYVARPFGGDRAAGAIGFELGRGMRDVAETIERDIRHAGFMVPASGAVCAVDNVDTPDRLYLSDASVLDPEHGARGTGNGAPIAGDGVPAGAVAAWRTRLVLDDVPDYDNDGDGKPEADFAQGAGVIVTDRRSPERGSACGGVLEVDAQAGVLRVEIASGALAPGADAELLAIPAHEYRIGPGEVLLRDGVELARETADLQVAFFVDANGDNVEQVDELVGYGAGPRYLSGAVDLRAAREIRVHTVLLSRRGTENGRVEVRRRTHTTRELLRNLVLR